MEKLENPEVPIRVLLKGVGGISESDILLADASQAIVIGFRVAPEDRAVSLADEKKIDIRRYDIIYQVTDEIKKAVEGMLVPEIKEVHLGRAVVRQMFKISKVGTVAGLLRHPGLDRAVVQGPPDPRGTRDLQGLDRGLEAVQGRRQGGPRRIRVRHQDHELRRHQGRRRDRGLPDRHHSPDTLSRTGRRAGGEKAPARRAHAPFRPQGLARCTWRCSGSRSESATVARAKRRTIRAIVDKIHRHFNVSVAEVDRARACLGERPGRGLDRGRGGREAREILDRVAEAVGAHPRVEILDIQLTEL